MQKKFTSQRAKKIHSLYQKYLIVIVIYPASVVAIVLSI